MHQITILYNKFKYYACGTSNYTVLKSWIDNKSILLQSYVSLVPKYLTIPSCACNYTAHVREKLYLGALLVSDKLNLPFVYRLLQQFDVAVLY